MKSQTYTITKKIAKHGSQSIIVIPNVLSHKIKPQMLVKVTIDVLDNGRIE
ncbi:MAG: hypothetical protein WCX73_00885 [Candidatus Pacearchaeota archaeon]|jgi:hypothetical protein